MQINVFLSAWEREWRSGRRVFYVHVTADCGMIDERFVRLPGAHCGHLIIQLMRTVNNARLVRFYWGRSRWTKF